MVHLHCGEGSVQCTFGSSLAQARIPLPLDELGPAFILVFVFHALSFSNQDVLHMICSHVHTLAHAVFSVHRAHTPEGHGLVIVLSLGPSTPTTFIGVNLLLMMRRYLVLCRIATTIKLPRVQPRRLSSSRWVLDMPLSPLPERSPRASLCLGPLR